MLKKILLVVAVVIVGLLVVAAFRPAAYHVERSAEMSAPAPAVFAQVNDFHNWDAWSPWAKLDPAAKMTYEGPASGTGASVAWEGNDEVGQGRMTILDSRAPEAVKIKLEFLKPWEATCTTDFEFKESGGKTTVTWSMDGENNYMCKVMSMFMDMDKMIGTDYEKGLASMRSIVEAKAK